MEPIQKKRIQSPIGQSAAFQPQFGVPCQI